MVFPVVMYGCESWTIKKAECWRIDTWTVVLEKTLESPLNWKEFKWVNPKGNQSCVFIGRTDVEAETAILWPPHEKSWLIGKDPDAARDWGQEEGDDRGWDGWMASPTQWTWVWQGSLVCCSPRGCKESDWLSNWTMNNNNTFQIKGKKT